MTSSGRTVTLLGPLPGNGSFSTSRYYEIYKRELPAFLPGWRCSAECPGASPIDMPSWNESRLTAWWANYVVWPRRLGTLTSDAFHILDQGLAWYARFLPRSGKRLITVHDLFGHMAAGGNIPLPVPPLRWRVLFRECVRQIRRADHVFAVSHFTADCLMRTLGLPSRNITVVYNVIDQEFRPLSGAARTAARLRLFKGAKYVLVHVGKPSTYKNRIGVLRAFAALHERLPDARLFLVHAPAPEEQTFLNGTSSRNAMRFLPSLSRRDLSAFYGAADLLLFPSLYEGFGWPPVEAMACGCPVVSSARGALAEVVGDAAVIIDDPLDAGALAGAAISVLTDRVLAADLRCRGLANVRRFQADLVLPQVAQVYRTALA